MKSAIYIGVFALFISTCGYTQQHKLNGIHITLEKTPVKPGHFQELESINADWVAISAKAYGSAFSPVIEFDTEWQPQMFSKESVIQAITLAHDKGYKVFVDLSLYMEGETNEPSFLKSTEGRVIWQQHYRTFLLSYAQLCDSLEVELLSIGNDLPIALFNDTTYWTSLIDTVRSHYSGKLTYAADATNANSITFWTRLDYIGVNAFIPCDSSDVPDMKALSDCLGQERQALKELSEQFHNPVLFTSFGYRSISGTTGDQSQLPPVESYNPNQGYNQISQVYAFSVFFKTFWSQEFIAGGFIWRWHLGMDANDYSKTTGYTPQDKPVLNVIKTWFKMF